MFSKVRPEDIFSDIVGENFRVRTCTGNVFIGRCRGFLYEKVYSFARKTPRQKVLFLLAWLFLKFFSSKRRLCTEFCGEDFGGIMVRFSGLGILVGV